MDALISGVAARAVFIEMDGVSYVEAERPDVKISVSRDAVPYLLLDAHDVEKLDSTTETSAFRLLLRKYNEDRGLRLLQMILDPEEDQELRRDSAIFLSEILANTDVKSNIANWAFSVPMPYDTLDTITLETISVNTTISEFVTSLGVRQDDIIRFQDAWARIPDNFFLDPEARKQFELVLITRGLFRKLVEASGDPVATNNSVLECYRDLADQPNYRQVIGAWTKGVVTRQRRRHAEHIEEEVTTEFRARAAQARSLTQGFKVYQNVRRQQEGIKAQLRRGDAARAAMFADQLIANQLQSGGPRYAAMSLCALAQEAKTLHQHNIQLEWLRRAIAIAPDDAWAHGQAGDAYLAVYRLNEAHQEYETVTRLGDGQFGLTGVARVLRANGRLDEALKICTRARDEFPDHAEAFRAWAVYSEILRDMWKFEDALSSYDESIKRFPQEKALWCGRAAVLTDMGRLDDALDAYARTIAEFPNDPVARGGRADVLKISGRLDEALADYEDAIRTFPENPVLVCGRAGVLREQGRYDLALSAYFEAMKLFPYEPSAFSGYAEVLKDQGNLEQALFEYDIAIEKFPQDRWCRNGRASVLRKYGRFEDALKAYDENVRDFPYDLIGLIGRANILKCLGYYDEALKGYDVIIARRSDYSIAIFSKAAIYVILGQFNEADKLLPKSLPYTNAEWVAFHIRGMMHLKRNQFQEAINIFTKGVLQVPFYRERDYFQNALAVANIRMENFNEALQAVQRSSDAIAQVLQIHCYSELGMPDAATAVFAAMNDNVPPSVLLLRDELAATYKITDALPRHTSSWLAETEIEVLLQAA